jgi:hypothetical protein
MTVSKLPVLGPAAEFDLDDDLGPCPNGLLVPETGYPARGGCQFVQLRLQHLAVNRLGARSDDDELWDRHSGTGDAEHAPGTSGSKSIPHATGYAQTKNVRLFGGHYGVAHERGALSPNIKRRRGGQGPLAADPPLRHGCSLAMQTNP